MSKRAMGAAGLAAGLVLMAGCGKPGKPEAAAASSTNRSGNPLTAPVDYLGAVGQAQKTAVKVTDLASLRQAIQAFQAGEDRLPRHLQELVSEGYLPRLPDVPRGMQLVYQPQSGQVQVVPAAPAAPPPPR